MQWPCDCAVERSLGSEFPPPKPARGEYAEIEYAALRVFLALVASCVRDPGALPSSAFVTRGTRRKRVDSITHLIAATIGLSAPPKAQPSRATTSCSAIASKKEVLRLRTIGIDHTEMSS